MKETTMPTATAAAPAAPKTAAAPAAAKAPTTAAPTASTPESKAEPTTPPKAKPAAKPKAKAKAQTKNTKPPQTPAGDKAEASAKKAVGEAMKKAKPASTTVPPGAEGNTAAEGKAKQAARGMGDNSIVTHKDIEDAAQSAGDALGGIMKGENRIAKTKEQANSLRKEAAEQLFPIFERLGIDQGTEAKEAKKIDEYEMLRINTCTAIAKKAGVKLEYKNNGEPKIPGDISKHWSRLFRSYNEGGDGGQTKADKNAREAAKDRTKTAKAKAEALDNLLIAHSKGETEQVDTLLKAARGRWGSALGV